MAKPRTTRARLIALVRAHPTWTIREYADALGVSPGRVHQLLVALGAEQVWRLRVEGAQQDA